MMRTIGLLICVGSMGMATGGIAEAAVTTTLLEPITSLDYTPMSEPPSLAVDSGGRVMIVYMGKGPGGQWRLYSLLRTGGTWQQSPVPMPEVGGYTSQFRIRQVAARSPNEGYHLLASYLGRMYYWQWRNGAWSNWELVSDQGSEAGGIALTGAGEPLIARGSTRFRIYRKQGGQWQETALASTTLNQQSLSLPIYAGARGIPHLLGHWRQVPIVATLPQGREPSVEDNWVIRPTGDREGWTSAVPTTAFRDMYALDWPHQLVYAVWKVGNALKLAWAPVGATSAAQWQTTQIEVPAGAHLYDEGYRLVANGYGHAGLAYMYSVKGDPSLHFRWLHGSGPGADLELVRPGTQTEACVFSSMSSPTLNFCIDPQGRAHLVISAVKRGEIPANKQRLYLATVTGGGEPLTDEPEVGGGTTTTGTGVTRGPKPDLSVSFVRPKTENEEFREYQDVVRAELSVTNQGAEYYGDLWLKVELDGALLRLRIPDATGHRYPLLPRGATKHIYLPPIRWETTPGTGWPPAPLTADYPSPAAQRLLHSTTGLGRKLVRVTVDPDNAIAEADENNNAAERRLVIYDGRNTLDRLREGNRVIAYGVNDLALVQTPVLRSNTPLWRAGYLQRPTTLQVVVGNPRFAGFFLNIPVVVYLDNAEIARVTLPILDNKPTLWSGSLGHLVMHGGATPKPNLSAAVLEIPVDLTQVSEGNHRLKVAIDPDDLFGDRQRDNNSAEMTVKVRGPGGTLRVQVVDKDDNTTPINRAFVSLRDLWAGETNVQGSLEVAEVPAGNYDGKFLSGQRFALDPRYFLSYASPFSITAGQTTTVTLPLEKAVEIVGDIYDASTNALLTGELISVALTNTDEYCPVYVNGPHYRILDVPPGEVTIRATAYSFQPTEVTQEVHRQGAQGTCRVDLRLQPGPRGTLEGTVLEEGTNRPLADAAVWLNGAPRFAGTDAQGRYRLEKVAVGPGYQVLATKANYTQESADSGPVTEGQTRQVPAMRLAKIVSRLKSIDFHAITWADFEKTRARYSYSVRLKYGQFDASLALLYHQLTGRPGIEADQLIVGITPGAWWESRVSTYEAPGIISVALQELKAGTEDVFNGNLLGVGTRIKNVYDYARGNFDPAQLGTGGEVVGTYTSASGTPYSPAVSLFGLPVTSGLGITSSGGLTTVRVDKVELTDGTNRKEVMHQWFSPQMAVYDVSGHFDLDNLQVIIYLKVMDQNLSVGPLYANSQNAITWKPGQDKWLRMDPRPYQVLPD